MRALKLHGRRQREVPRVPKLIRFEPSEVAAIDAARGVIPFARWVRETIALAIAK